MPILRDIALGRYVAVDSPVHRLDPRTKFLGSMVLMLATVTARTWAPVLLAGAAVLVGVLVARLPWRLPLRNLRPFAWLFAFTLVLHGTMTPGHLLWQVPHTGIEVTAEGLRTGALLSVRLAAVISIASLMTLTTAPMELTDGLERLLRPLRRFGFPAHELAMMVTIALRFIPVLVEEAERLHKAQLARGADFGGGPIRRARRLVPLLVPLFISAFGRADRLALAMESRCYRGGEGRTSYRQLQLGAQDALAAAATAGLAALIIWFPALPLR
ncbi:MAG: energy-coupling factor transporter transmembrane component T [Gemmatimonadota bacterium]